MQVLEFAVSTGRLLFFCVFRGYGVVIRSDLGM